MTPPALDLAVFHSGGPTPGIDIPFGTGVTGRDIATFNPSTGTSSLRVRLTPFDGYRVNVLARSATFGYAALWRASDKPMYLAKMSYTPEGHYRLEEPRWNVTRVTSMALSMDPNELFFATGSSNTIERKALDATPYQRFAGSSAGYRDGPASQALFNRPESLCLDSKAIYVADVGNAVIRRIDRQTRIVTTLAGRPNTAVLVDGPAGTGGFQFGSALGAPGSCAVIGDSLYVIDARSVADIVLRKINLNNGYVTTVEQREFPTGSLARDLTAHEGRLYMLQGYNSGEVRIEAARPFVLDVNALGGTTPLLLDVDMDGNLDLLVPLSAQYRAINYLRGHGDGTFKYVSQALLDQLVYGVAAADLDKDGYPDMIVTTPDSVRVFAGDGTKFVEDFAQRITAGSGNAFAWAELKDYDFDGDLDLGVIDLAGVFRVWLAGPNGRWGKGPGDLSEHFRFETGLKAARWFRTEDIDGDDRWELYGMSDGAHQLVFWKGVPSQR